MIKEYTKQKIIDEHLQYRKDLFPVKYTKHAKERMEERCRGNLIIFPEQIRITEQNIVKGLSSDGKYLFKVIIKLEWKKGEDIYLVILPNMGLIKSCWFKKQKKGI